MKELEFTLQSSLEANYLNIRLPGTAVLDEIAVRVIQEDCPDFLIPFRMVDLDGSISLKYKLMNTVAFSYYDKALSKETFIDLYLNLLAPFIRGKDWFLDYHSLCIDMHYVFVNKTSGKVYFVYIPEKACQNSDEEILKFFKDAFFNCHLEGDSEFQIFLYRMFARNDVTLAELHQTFVEERQKMAGQPGQAAVKEAASTMETGQGLPGGRGLSGGQAISGGQAPAVGPGLSEGQGLPSEQGLAGGRGLPGGQASPSGQAPPNGQGLPGAQASPGRQKGLAGALGLAGLIGKTPVAEAAGQAVRSEISAQDTAKQAGKNPRKGFLGNLLGGEKEKREAVFEEGPAAGESLGMAGDSGVLDEIFGKKEKKKEKKKKEAGGGLDFLGHIKKKDQRAPEMDFKGDAGAGFLAQTGAFVKETGMGSGPLAVPGGQTASTGTTAFISGGSLEEVTVENDLTEDRTEIAEDWDAQPAACLQLIDSPIPGAPERIGLDFDKPYITIGRTSSDETQPDVAFGREFSRIGRQHARIEKRGGRCYVIDLGSLNHTLLNGQALIPNQPYELKNGEELAFTASKPVRYRICL